MSARRALPAALAALVGACAEVRPASGAEPEPVPLASENVPAAPLSVEPRAEPTADLAAAELPPDEAELTAAVVQLFRQRCYECHGPGKRPKGGLRLSDLGAVRARGAEEAVLVPGKPDESELYRRLGLPAEDEDVMPPEDGPLASEERELVRRWIAAGAPLPVGEPGSETVLPVPAEPIAALTPAQRATRDEALARLVARGAHAGRLSATSEAVEVDLAVAVPPAAGAELALLAGLEPCLVELSLARMTLVDEDLAALAAFGELRRLRLDQASIGDGALVHLAPLARLESLNLHGTRVSAAAVPQLARFRALRRLYLGATAIPAQLCAELEAALPECQVFGDERR